MSFNDSAIVFNQVWKKYSRANMFHRSIREDIVNIFNTKRNRADLSTQEFWALRDMQFSVKIGETLGVYGPNGAGKSTILKLIAGVTYPTLGNLSARGRIAPLIEIGAGFHPDLTGRENIYMNGTILGMTIADVKKKMDSIVGFSETEEIINMPVKKYSSGMYLRLAFSIAFHSEADIYLIDEILSVGDAGFQRKCLEKINQLKKIGKTLIVITHDKPLMEQIVDRIIYIDKGQLFEAVATGS